MAQTRKKRKKQTSRSRSSRSRKAPRQKNKTLTTLSILMIAVVVLAFVIMLGWDHGIGDFFQHADAPVLKEMEISDISSSNGVLLSAKGLKVLGEKNMEEEIYPASLTKIMTVIVAIEELKDLNQEITLTEDMFDRLYGRDATQAGFQAGERVRAIDLIYGAMLPSGAECCLGLAYHVSGSEETFVGLMNKKAEKIGMKHTHFCDTTGLHDPNHYTTVFDMALLFRYALRNDTFREVAGSSWHSTQATNIHPDGITYYSSLFNGIPDAYVTGGKILGGKTGFTNQAGLCLASYAEIQGREYILVTAGGWDTDAHFNDARMIYNRIGEKLLGLN